MNVVDELLEQRDRILFGTWVPHAPGGYAPGMACLVGYGDERFAKTRYISVMARDFVTDAIVALHPRTIHTMPTVWNDARGRTRSEVLEVLDEAIRRAKAVVVSEGVDSDG